MQTGLIVWLLILAGSNIAIYVSWENIKDTNSDGGYGDAIAFFIFFVIVVIADISTAVSLIF